ncbi:MAG: hypothetical protein Hals2KO_15000 [Halioglobus sp.]
MCVTKQYQSLEAKNDALRDQGKPSVLERFTRDDLLELFHELETYMSGPVSGLSRAITSEMTDWHTLFTGHTSD